MEQAIVAERIFKTVFTLSNALQASGDKLSNELTLKQWFLLLILCKKKKQNPTVNDVSNFIGVSRQSAKKMICILETRNYLLVKQSPVDSRALCISPTQKTVDFFKKNKSIGHELLHQIFDCINDDELEITLRVLQKMRDNLQKNAFKGLSDEIK
ncbi:MAG: hypothetical protein RR580_07535 [Christensenellaceae bacterium]